ncbi:MAG: hypothetical protein AAGF89_15460, partial [Bacteroidota bacterium]
VRYLTRRIPIPFLSVPLGGFGAFTLVYSLGELMSWYYSRVEQGESPQKQDIQQAWQDAQAEATQKATAWLQSLRSTKTNSPTQS